MIIYIYSTSIAPLGGYPKEGGGAVSLSILIFTYATSVIYPLLKTTILRRKRIMPVLAISAGQIQTLSFIILRRDN